MLKAISSIVMLASIALLVCSAWAFSSACTGRPLGYDCGSWQIFTVNAFAPIGLLGAICAGCSLWFDSWRPQFVLLAGVLAAVGWWLWHIHGLGN